MVCRPNSQRDLSFDRLNPARDRSRRRAPRYAPEWLEGRLSPSSLGGLASEPALVQPLDADVPYPEPIDYPPDIPPYEPPVPPGGPATPK